MKPTYNDVRRIVEETLHRLLTRNAPSPTQRQIVDAQFVESLPEGTEFHVPPGARVTPLARDRAMERRITLVEGTQVPGTEEVRGERVIAIGADHGGYALKETLKPFLAELGWEVIDVGTHSPESVDYPDFAYAVAQLVVQKRARYGIMIDGAGIGSCMACNKVPGIRAAMCYDIATAKNSREHNHANVLTLGAGMIGTNLAKQIVRTWLETPYGGGRHKRRVDKIAQIERRYMRGR